MCDMVCYSDCMIIKFLLFVYTTLNPNCFDIQSNVRILKKQICVGSLGYHQSLKSEITSWNEVMTARKPPGAISGRIFCNSVCISLKCSKTSVEITRSYRLCGNAGKKYGSKTWQSYPSFFINCASTGSGPLP